MTIDVKILEGKIAALKKMVMEKKAKVTDIMKDPGFRDLRKQLKRNQRKYIQATGRKGKKAAPKEGQPAVAAQAAPAPKK